MGDCVFCKIIASELPSSTLYEDDTIIAFLDIKPVNHGHTLVVPKIHYKTPLETPDETLAHIMRVTKKIATAITDSLGVKGFNITFNNGEIAGQVVPHTHLHIIPRYENDNLKLWSQKPYQEGEQEKVAEKIKAVLTKRQ